MVKTIKFEDLELSVQDMKAIATGARLFMAPAVEEETTETASPGESLVTRRDMVDE